MTEPSKLQQMSVLSCTVVDGLSARAKSLMDALPQASDRRAIFAHKPLIDTVTSLHKV
jgi:hypothetical protein